MGHHFYLLSLDFILLLEINCRNNSLFLKKKRKIDRKKTCRSVLKLSFSFQLCWFFFYIFSRQARNVSCKKTLDNNVFPLYKSAGVETKMPLITQGTTLSQPLLISCRGNWSQHQAQRLNFNRAKPINVFCSFACCFACICSLSIAFEQKVLCNSK